ncbi:hypothetical protein DFH29DRAFT_238360 [Suillus ampliporus]|nr:hypothetical protein DFH29DRAFT_238360 [Suillus ampliporus]
MASPVQNIGYNLGSEMLSINHAADRSFTSAPILDDTKFPKAPRSRLQLRFSYPSDNLSTPLQVLIAPSNLPVDSRPELPLYFRCLRAFKHIYRIPFFYLNIFDNARSKGQFKHVKGGRTRGINPGGVHGRHAWLRTKWAARIRVLSCYLLDGADHRHQVAFLVHPIKHLPPILHPLFTLLIIQSFFTDLIHRNLREIVQRISRMRGICIPAHQVFQQALDV